MKVFLAALFLAMMNGAMAAEVEALIEDLKEVAEKGSGISGREQEVAKKLQEKSAEAVPFLLPLLRDRREDVRALAGFTLCDITGLSEADLPPLMKACHEGNGWLPFAIAHIGTPEAVSFLVDEIVRKPQTQTQFTGALVLLGPKAVEPLLAVYRSDRGWNDELEGTINSIFQEMGPRASSAVGPLLQIAENSKASSRMRCRALSALGSIGRAAEPVVPALLRLRKSPNEDIRNAAGGALVGIGGQEAAAILAAILAATSDGFEARLIMRDIAQQGERGIGAAPVVRNFMQHEDWETRACAVRTLGYIGDRQSSALLIRALDNKEDWRVVYCAAGALGQLNDQGARRALEALAENHWFPPVRRAARNALQSAKPSKEDNFAMEFFAYENVGEDVPVKEGDEKRLRFPAISRDPPISLDARPELAGQKTRVGPAVEVQGGWLVGTDRGEFGGGLEFIDFQKKARLLAGANTEAIYRTKAGIFAVTGLAHLFMNEGIVYKIEDGGGGHWKARPWRVLPGAPKFSRLLPDGRIFVWCHGGIVLVSSDGTLRSLSRADAIEVD